MTAQTSEIHESTTPKKTRGPDKNPRKRRSDARQPMRENTDALHTGMHDMHAAEVRSVVHDDAFPETWKPRGDIDTPEPLPGYEQRWIRIQVRGVADAENQIGKHGEGWRPRPLSSIPVGERRKYPAITTANYGNDVIRKGDLVLCYRPKALGDQARDFFRNKRDRQFETVVQKTLAESAVRGSEGRGFGAPRIEEHHSETIHTRRPNVAAG